MTETEALERLRSLLAPRLAALGLTLGDVTDTTNLTRSGVLDSFALMDLLAEAESTFGVQLDLDALENEAFTSLKGMARAFTNAKRK